MLPDHAVRQEESDHLVVLFRGPDAEFLQSRRLAGFPVQLKRFHGETGRLRKADPQGLVDGEETLGSRAPAIKKMNYHGGTENTEEKAIHILLRALHASVVITHLEIIPRDQTHFDARVLVQF